MFSSWVQLLLSLTLTLVLFVFVLLYSFVLIVTSLFSRFSHIVEVFQPHFEIVLSKENDLYKSLKETNETISKSWATQSLGHVRQYSDIVFAE